MYNTLFSDLLYSQRGERASERKQRQKNESETAMDPENI